MTDRLNGCFVTFKKDTREDDAEAILNAIRLLSGVADVSGNVSDFNAHIAEQRAKLELREKLWELLNEQS